MEFFEVIDCRHSVRTYRPDAVPDELIIQCLEAARMAPSWRNGQCWRFLIVRDATIISQLAAQRIYGYPINHWLRSAPVVVVACAEPGESGLLGDPPQEIGKAILAQVPNTVDLYWVDFTAYDIWPGLDSARASRVDRRFVTWYLQRVPWRSRLPGRSGLYSHAPN